MGCCEPAQQIQSSFENNTNKVALSVHVVQANYPLELLNIQALDPGLED